MESARVPRAVRKFVAKKVAIHLPFFDAWSHWIRLKLGRSDLATLLLISACFVWFRNTDTGFINFYQFLFMSFKLEEPQSNINQDTMNANNNNNSTSIFYESLIEHLPNQISTTLIKHSTATISFVYALLFVSFLLFSSPIYQLRYMRNRSFTGYSFMIYVIYSWMFISTLSHMPIIHQLVEEPLALFPYFYGLTVLTVGSVNVILRILLNRIFVFHIGPRKRTFEILQSSSFISLACSMLYANCGNNFEIFELTASKVFCQRLFETVQRSGNENYTDIPPVLTMWLTGVSIMCVNYLVEGTSTHRFIFFTEKDLTNSITQYIETEVMTDVYQTPALSKDITGTSSYMKSASETPSTTPAQSPAQVCSPSKEPSFEYDDADKKLDEIMDANDSPSSSLSFAKESSSAHIKTPKRKFSFASDDIISIESDAASLENAIIRPVIHSAEPRDVHEMTSWFDMSIGWLLLDIVVALGNLYDRRAINDSLISLQSIIRTKNIKDEDDGKQARGQSSAQSSPQMVYNRSLTAIGSKMKNGYKRKMRSASYAPSANSPTTPDHSSSSSKSIKRNVSELSDSEQCKTSCFSYLEKEKELWFDFMADCGDGFHPSYEIARLLAQPFLIGTNGIKLQRAKLLLLGGDLAYPGPTFDNYKKKFFRVFEDALRPPNRIMNMTEPEISYHKPELPDGHTLASYKGPTALIIPGNHDWYDGLKTFQRFVCSRNWLGGWFLPQTSSYFVSALPHNWWIFAADYALEDDIDTKQFEYFAQIVETYFDNQDRKERVVIITHMPDWIINDHQNKNHGQNLQCLINNVIGIDRLRLRLAGDIHNYTRHESVSCIKSGLKYNMVETNDSPNAKKFQKEDVMIKAEDKYNAPMLSSSRLKRSQSALFDYEFPGNRSQLNDATLIVSGGGGAFLHPTHVPEKKIISVNGMEYDRVCEYPSIRQSRAYAFFNIFGFRKRNLQFDLMGGILYYLLVSSLFPLCHLNLNSHTDELSFFTLFYKFQQIFIQETFEIFEISYISVTVFFVCWVGMYIWTESHLPVSLRITISTVHLFAHYISALTVIILMEMIIEAAIENELIGIKTPFDIFREHFSKTHDLILHLDNNYTFGYITSILKLLFTVIDITGFHVFLRKSICQSKYKQIELIFQTLKDVPFSTESLLKYDKYYDLLPSRFYRFWYHLTAFLFYFIFAAPVVSFVVGLYLYFSAKFGKFNEVFSSLRLEKHKNFVRFHLKPDGSLHCYVVGIDKVPKRWRQDPKWDGRGILMNLTASPRNGFDGEDKRASAIARDMRYLGASHTWKYPSRWIPFDSKGDMNMNAECDYRRVQIIDQFVLH